jgi:hypothetical protein
MANNELCKHCGYKEGPHDIAADIRYGPESECPYLKDGTSRENALVRTFEGQPPPCEKFESETQHKPGCPVWIDRNNREYFCHELEGGCEQLIRIENFEEEPPSNSAHKH